MNVLEYDLKLVNGEVRLKLTAFDHPDRGEGDLGVFGGMGVWSAGYPALDVNSVYLPGLHRENDRITATHIPDGDPEAYMEKVRNALEGWRATWDTKAELGVEPWTLASYLHRQREWSLETFGDGKRTVGVTKHIEKECQEVRDDPNDLMEWIDIVILALDGYWRAGGDPQDIEAFLDQKQQINFKRNYPRTAEDEVSEHDRSGDDAEIAHLQARRKEIEG